MGFSYKYPEFQTAMYYIRFVHNDYLQIALDIGIIPMILFVIILIKSLFSKNINNINKLILFFLMINMFFDINIEFFVIMAILILVIFEEKNEKVIKFSFVITGITIIIIAIAFYFGIAQFMNFLGKSSIATKMISIYTDPKVEKMNDDLNDNNLIGANIEADEIIANNKYIVEAYETKALYYLDNKEFDKSIEMLDKTILLDKYNMEKYDNYVYAISQIIEYELNSKNYDKVQKYMRLVIKVPDRVKELKRNTSKLQKYFIDKPDYKLNNNTLDYIDKIKTYVK